MERPRPLVLARLGPAHHRKHIVELTPDQIGAARACGCVLAPATEAQVQRFSMQRRIFSIDGRLFVATRGGGFYETHGTLAALIEKHAPAAPAPAQDTTGGTGAPAVAQEAAAPPVAEAAAPEPKGRRAATAKPRKGRTPRPLAASADWEPAATGGAAAEPCEAAETLAGVEASQTRRTRARVVGRRRAGEPKAPRWAIAGKVRRGRLK